MTDETTGRHTLRDLSTEKLIEAVARECAEMAIREGSPAAGRGLDDQEDAFEADYESAEEAIGRPMTKDEMQLFRRAYSGRLAAEEGDQR